MILRIYYCAEVCFKVAFVWKFLLEVLTSYNTLLSTLFL